MSSLCSLSRQPPHWSPCLCFVPLNQSSMPPCALLKTQFWLKIFTRHPSPPSEQDLSHSGVIWEPLWSGFSFPPHSWSTQQWVIWFPQHSPSLISLWAFARVHLCLECPSVPVTLALASLCWDSSPWVPLMELLSLPHQDFVTFYIRLLWYVSRNM